ncbi:hypothetical protein GGR50DRAFT_208983 [Xylaria sp. CBS 124048]|nr:hypothetical protein GGR50DRAFT_208983 [Xylaria sp. CBS 124048]
MTDKFQEAHCVTSTRTLKFAVGLISVVTTRYLSPRYLRCTRFTDKLKGFSAFSEVLVRKIFSSPPPEAQSFSFVFPSSEHLYFLFFIFLSSLLTHRTARLATVRARSRTTDRQITTQLESKAFHAFNHCKIPLPLCLILILNRVFGTWRCGTNSNGRIIFVGESLLSDGYWRVGILSTLFRPRVEWHFSPANINIFSKRFDNYRSTQESFSEGRGWRGGGGDGQNTSPPPFSAYAVGGSGIS